MRCSRILGVLVCASVAIVVAPTYVMAQAVDGVKGVRNDLQVVQPGDRKAIDISDTDITRQIEGRLSKDARLRKVDVRTDDGAVILTGTVSSIGTSARASELARGVPGVRMVKNELTYDPATRRLAVETEHAEDLQALIQKP